MSTVELGTGTEVEILRDLYRQINAQATAQARTDSELIGIKTALGELSTGLREISSKLNAGTDWNVLLAGAAVVLGLSGAAGKMVTDPLRDRIVALEAAEARYVEAISTIARIDERSRMRAEDF